MRCTFRNRHHIYLGERIHQVVNRPPKKDDVHGQLRQRPVDWWELVSSDGGDVNMHLHLPFCQKIQARLVEVSFWM